ncbi:MAG: hypothetical protein Q9160_008551 [Pyrenula sp. 1 TL-2023]
MPVISAPTPIPAINLATRNMPMSTLAAHRAAPTIEKMAPIPDQAVSAAPKAEPAQLRPFAAPMRFEVRAYPDVPSVAR